MTQTLYHHKFTPWRIAKDGAHIVANEATLDAITRWNRPFACPECGKRFERRKHCENHCKDCAGDEPIRDRPRVLVGDKCDLFEDWGGQCSDSRGKLLVHGFNGWIPCVDEQLENASGVTLDDVRASLFRTIDATPNVDWLIVTSKPENVRRLWVPYGPNAADGEMDEWRENVWLAVRVTCQDDADRLIPEMLKCRDLCAKLLVFRDGEFSEVPT